MKRTTIMAPEALLQELGRIAQQDQISLAEVIRQGMQLRAQQAASPPRFIGAGRSSEPPYDTGRRAGDLGFEPRSWR